MWSCSNRHLLRALAIAVVGTVALSSCSQGADGEADRSPSPTGTPTSSTSTSGGASTSAAGDLCSFLSASQVEALAGKALRGQVKSIPGSTLLACQYGDLNTVGVQVTNNPADEWAKALPDFVRQLQASDAFGSEAVRKQLENAADAIEAGNDLPPGRACEFFSTLLEAQGQPPNTLSTAAYLPTDEDPVAISAQSCEDQRYASVVVARPDLTPGGDLESLVISTLADLSGAPD